MPEPLICVPPAADLNASLADRRVLFTHIPKTAGTTVDNILGALLKARGMTGGRIRGTIYGQPFGGADKEEAAAAARALEPAAVANAQGLWAHVPDTVWDEAIPWAGSAARVTLLRDPVDRLLSMYRTGLAFAAWEPETSPAELLQDGRMTDNAQVRQLAGQTSAEQACDAATLDAALTRLRERYALVGFAEHFDPFLAAATALFGWPMVVYSRSQVSRTEIPEDQEQAWRAAIEPYCGWDRALIAAVAAWCAQSGCADVWVCPTVPMEPSAEDQPRPDSPAEKVLFASPMLRFDGADFGLFPIAELAAMRDHLIARGLEFRDI